MTVQLMFDVVLQGRLAGLTVGRDVVNGVGRWGTAGTCRAKGGDGRREEIFLSSEKLFNSSDWKVWKVFIKRNVVLSF